MWVSTKFEFFHNYKWLTVHFFGVAGSKKKDKNLPPVKMCVEALWLWFCLEWLKVNVVCCGLSAHKKIQCWALKTTEPFEGFRLCGCWPCVNQDWRFLFCKIDVWKKKKKKNTKRKIVLLFVHLVFWWNNPSVLNCNVQEVVWKCPVMFDSSFLLCLFQFEDENAFEASVGAVIERYEKKERDRNAGVRLFSVDWSR